MFQTIKTVIFVVFSCFYSENRVRNDLFRTRGHCNQKKPGELPQTARHRGSSGDPAWEQPGMVVRYPGNG